MPLLASGVLRRCFFKPRGAAPRSFGGLLLPLLLDTGTFGARAASSSSLQIGDSSESSNLGPTKSSSYLSHHHCLHGHNRHYRLCFRHRHPHPGKFNQFTSLHARQRQQNARGFTTDSVERWPDGTPKKFQGAESWKNWINFQSAHDELTDRLNRRRHFFWEVDARGALWRVEVEGIDDSDEMQPRITDASTERRTGQMKEPKILDDFFGHIRLNDSGFYEEQFPFLVKRAHELYFCKATWISARAHEKDNNNEGVDRLESSRGRKTRAQSPIVFNNLEREESGSGLILRHSCPGTGHIVSTVDTAFDPASLLRDGEGRLYHPVSPREVVSKSGKVKKKRGRGEGLALLEDKIVQTIAEGPESFYQGENAHDDASASGGIRFSEEEGDEDSMTLVWLNGVEHPVRLL